MAALGRALHAPSALPAARSPALEAAFLAVVNPVLERNQMAPPTSLAESFAGALPLLRTFPEMDYSVVAHLHRLSAAAARRMPGFSPRAAVAAATVQCERWARCPRADAGARRVVATGGA